MLRPSAILWILCASLLHAQDDRGKKLFEAHCALCHGETGLGGRGPNLARPTLPRAPDDQRLVNVISRGIAGTEMPGFWQLTDREVGDVAAYVRSLGRIAPETLPGDPERGRGLYEKSGCASCHIVRGDGTGLGPELSEIGAQRNAAYLRESIVHPAASVPPQFLVITAVTRDGKNVRGMRVNEDSFTIQLRDASGRFYSFRKSDLTSLQKDTNASLMPPFSQFTSAELDDLVAYLASLRGQQ